MEVKVAQNVIFSKIRKFDGSHINLVELSNLLFTENAKDLWVMKTIDQQYLHTLLQQ